MSAFAAARSVLSSSTIRLSATKLSAAAKPARGSAFSLPKQRPLSQRICRSPVEMSSVMCGVVDAASHCHGDLIAEFDAVREQKPLYVPNFDVSTPLELMNLIQRFAAASGYPLAQRLT